MCPYQIRKLLECGDLVTVKRAAYFGLVDFTSDTYCDYAAKSGNLALLQWLLANGCPWSENTCFMAAQYGHLHILQWVNMLDINGETYAAPSSWDDRAGIAAARYGNLEILK